MHFTGEFCQSLSHNMIWQLTTHTEIWNEQLLPDKELGSIRGILLSLIFLVHINVHIHLSYTLDVLRIVVCFSAVRLYKSELNLSLRVLVSLVLAILLLKLVWHSKDLKTNMCIVFSSVPTSSFYKPFNETRVLQ